MDSKQYPLHYPLYLEENKNQTHQNLRGNKRNTNVQFIERKSALET